MLNFDMFGETLKFKTCIVLNLCSSGKYHTCRITESIIKPCILAMHIADRLWSKKPQTHLKTGGDFFQATESTENFVHPRVKQTQQQAELVRDEEEMEEEDRRMRSLEREQEENRKKDEEMKLLVSKLEDLNGRPLEIPEYRDAYKVFKTIHGYSYTTAFSVC